MIKNLGLRTVIYSAPDLSAAKEWYTKAFGVAPYFDEPFYVGFNIAGYELGLDPNGGQTTGNSVAAYWGVENVQQAFDSMIALGATGHESPQNVGGDIEVATVYDPWGNLIGLIYNPEFKLP